jgi:glutamate synthase domain-containing protein 3
VSVATGLVQTLDLDGVEVRELNARLHAAEGGSWRVTTPGGRHSIAAGLTAELTVEVEGHAGYYCAGMNQRASVRINGNCGVGVAENMMSGSVTVRGDASQAAGASAHGGLLVVEGNAAARCGISLKGADVVVRGSVGHMTGFMAQSGRIVVCGDAGEALGDSIYEARVYVRGEVAGLGADCVEKEMRGEHLAELGELLECAGAGGLDPSEFRRYGSARRLYNFDVDDAGGR